MPAASASRCRRRAHVDACGERLWAPAKSTCAYRRLRADVGGVRWRRNDGVEVSTASCGGWERDMWIDSGWLFFFLLLLEEDADRG
jgi:hypothetical protein